MDNEGQNKDEEEHEIVEETIEHVVFLLTKLTSVDLIEKLHENEGLENNSVSLDFCRGLIQFPFGSARVSSNIFLGGVEWIVILIFYVEKITHLVHEYEKDGNLKNGLTNDVSPHNSVDNGIGFFRGHAVEKEIIRRLSSESKGSECVHDQVNPEKLYGGERLFSEKASTSKDEEHGDDVDSKLELKELANVIIDVTAIFDSGQNGTEVIIQERNITSVLCNFGSSDSHGEANIRSVKGGGIVGTVSGHSNCSSNLDKTINEHEFVIGL